MSIVPVSSRLYSCRDFIPFLQKPTQVKLNRPVQKLINESHARLTRLLSTKTNIYGVNTGFGKLSQVSIDEKDQKKLQLNLVRSHAAGVGEPLDSGLTRIVMFLKLLTLAKGVSGVRLAVADQIVRFLNYDILPVIPRKGSVGASGDLAPLAHMALALIGEGEVHFKDRILPGILALREAGIKPLVLGPKEGLSLINGTQVSTAFAIKALVRSFDILKTADIAGALSVEASLSSRNIFNPAIHALKQHKGQQQTAHNVWQLLEGSDIIASHEDCDRIQDPYSIRCIPHVHGASRDVCNVVRKIIENEINSVSDNPLILPGGKVYSSGHFHAAPVAQAMDILAIAISEIGAISERRTHFFMKGISNKIPSFVARNPGLESGLMLAQVTAAALVSENKTLSHPASVDSIPTSAGHEDFVSMAPWAGRKALRILDNVTEILAIEILVAASATVLFHTGLKSSKGTTPLINLLQQKIKFTSGDRPLAVDIKTISNLVQSGRIVKNIEKHISLE